MTKWVELYGVKFKRKFVERYQKLLGERFDEFIRVSIQPLRKSFRINTIKVKDDLTKQELIQILIEKSEIDNKKIEEKVEKFLENQFYLKPNPFKEVPKASEILKNLKEEGWEIDPIPFYKYGFWADHKEGRRDIGNTVEFQLGYIYSQEAASMIPPIALDPKPGEIVLDLCAAPGSKTTQIAMHMENEGVIVANDIDLQRISALAENLERCGVCNTIITRMDGRKFIRLPLKFDKVLVDAPCSGVGALRKSWKTLHMWNPDMVKRLSNLQKQLIKAGFEVLKEGGVLVYSTCTLEPEENEEVISRLLERYDNAKIEKIHVPNLKSSEPVLEWEGKKYVEDVKYCLRIYPQDNDTEGFFIAKIKKV